MQKRAAAMFIGMGMLVLPAASPAAPGDTTITEMFTNATIDISPGLCLPGDTADCVGPEVAQFRGGFPELCIMNGRFEGADLPLNAPCGFEIYGFQEGVTPGTKPACGASRFYTSDETTAFGPNRTNKLIVNGVARSIYVEGVSVGALIVFTTVEWDDDDADTDPHGDHQAVGLPNPVQRSSSGSGIPCVTTPLDAAILPAGGSVHSSDLGAHAGVAREWVACYGVGGVTLTPGATMTPRPIVFEGEIVMDPCISSIPTIRSGVMELQGGGAAVSCPRPGVNGIAHIVWNDGSTSEMSWIGVPAPPPTLAVYGRITSGTAFAGNDVVIPGLTTGDPTECTTPEGVTSVSFTELDIFI